LTNLEGLSGLAVIRGDLYIERNDALTHLDGLEGLTEIIGNLNIGDFQSNMYEGYYIGNASLRNLEGLSGLIAVDRLSILGNRGLSTCAAEALRDLLRAAGWSGSAFIRDNDDSGSCP
jgi:hypothetical protein